MAGPAWVAADHRLQPALIFWPGDCAKIPSAAHAGFHCATYKDGDPTAANHALGPDYQVGCHVGHAGIEGEAEVIDAI